MTFRRLLQLALLTLGLLASPQFLHAQGSDLGAIRGTVTDPSGAQISHAHIEITDLNTQIVRTYDSGGQGSFDASALPSGKYKVAISAPGFGTTIVENVTVTGANVASADVVLHPSTVQQ